MEKIAVIGLGYVGLPLAIELGKKYITVGFDINEKRIEELNNCIDRTNEVDAEQFSESKYLTYTSNETDIEGFDYFIVTVPTPIDIFKKPDLKPLISASEIVGKRLKKGNIVIYESTVYPGVTEEVCVPILEQKSGFKFNIDFYCGYSPERINPGDKIHTVAKIKKVTSGSTPEIGEKIDRLYKSIIEAGTHLAPSIKVAEAAKVIENAQRDINIAFVNELSLIFEKMNIDTSDVLEAAGTKWNFLNFKPGLVGGHCIGVDPYYLTYKAESLGYHPEVILAGRRINDLMSIQIANSIVKLMIKKGLSTTTSNALVLGVTFKENCPDIRNSKVIDLVNELEGFGIDVDVYDPEANKEEVRNEYNIDLIEEITSKYSVIILAVGHDIFRSIEIADLAKNVSAVFDLKSFLPRELVDKRL
ncbi:MAG: nucleotide sugar dehydrogenase [Cyclobacteriaceae bacterium]|nr:nucleotide sugar dehydrogenase [Cyclobacteriaceae bacterium]